MNWQDFERAESAGIMLLSLFAYFQLLDGSFLFFLALVLLPDLSMAGYLKNDDAGALVYNLFHNYLGPAALLGYSMLTGDLLLQQIGLVWTAHIAGDRLMGFGLKEKDFKTTHLGKL
ncbi:MAG: DUF4260 family protein [Candidatus Aenigmatarchaeota archaeon]